MIKIIFKDKYSTQFNVGTKNIQYYFNRSNNYFLGAFNICRKVDVILKDNWLDLCSVDH